MKCTLAYLLPPSHFRPGFVNLPSPFRSAHTACAEETSRIGAICGRGDISASQGWNRIKEVTVSILAAKTRNPSK